MGINFGSVAAVMDPVASTVSGILNNASNAKMAREAMAFSERMRNSQYQSAVADMRKAGLNPALAYANGGSASPMGTSATMENPLKGGEISQSVNSALTLKNVAADIGLKGKQGEEIDSNVRKNDAQTLNISSLTAGQMGLLSAQITETLARSSNLDAQTKRTLEMLRGELDIQQSTLSNLNASTAGSLQAAVESKARTRQINAGVPLKEFEGAAGNMGKQMLDTIGDRASSAKSFLDNIGTFGKALVGDADDWMARHFPGYRRRKP